MKANPQIYTSIIGIQYKIVKELIIMHQYYSEIREGKIPFRNITEWENERLESIEKILDSLDIEL